MVIRTISTLLMLGAVYMGLKQGYAMLDVKPQMLGMFSKWGFNKTGIMINGAVTIIAALLILHPKTFLWGNFLMAAGILLIICFHLLDRDLKGVAIELPFLLLNLVILYLGHPLKR
ncbi:DoxX family protein [Dyadobacter sp. OTU695]|uniref:DoxX family protein n=1 Tax=Dyadobacter sp. OTU695 TaxID=3043860 RepID=UPI00313F0A07